MAKEKKAGAMDAIKNAFKRKKKQPELPEPNRDENVVINGKVEPRINKAKLIDEMGSRKKIKELIKRRREQLRKQKD